MPPKASRGGRRPGQGRGKALPNRDLEAGTASSTADFDSKNSSGSHSTDSPRQIKTEAPPDEGNSLLSCSLPATAVTGNSTRAARNGATASAMKAGRGASRGVATAPATSRFKPKNIRRSATELAELAHKEQLRQADLAVQLEREQARLMRGRGKLRGRGDAMGKGRGALGAASSIFGTVPESLKKASGVLSLRSGSGGGGTGFGGSTSSGSIGRFSIKNEGSGSTQSAGGRGGGGGKSGYEFYTPIYPGEDEDTIRVDIEHINLISDDEDGAFYKDSKNKFTPKGGLKPVRLHREEHKKRVTVVNTAPDEPTPSAPNPPTTKTLPDSDEEGLFVVDDSSPSKKKAIREKEFTDKQYGENSLEPKIKAEPDSGAVSDSHRPSIPELSNIAKKHSPESGRKIDAELNSYLPENPSETMESTSIKSELKLDQDTRRLIQKHHRKPVIQTEEDRDEYERHIEDVAILVNELGGLQEKSSKSLDADGDLNMEDTNAPLEEQEPDKKEGRLYLFQFPPVLPVLYNPLTEEKPELKPIIKQEGEKIESRNSKGKDVDRSIDRHNGKGKAKSVDPSLNVKLEDIKIEDDAELLNNHKEDITGRREVVHEEGYIGKLVVRESGRVELCWGGTRLLVGRGVDAEFLTTGVIVDGIERGPKGGGTPEGKAFGMGRIMGKFVVTPDWQSMIKS